MSKPHEERTRSLHFCTSSCLFSHKLPLPVLWHVALVGMEMTKEWVSRDDGRSHIVKSTSSAFG